MPQHSRYSHSEVQTHTRDITILIVSVSKNKTGK